MVCPTYQVAGAISVPAIRASHGPLLAPSTSLRELPAGRYVLARVDEAVALSSEEEAGLIAALKSAETRVVPHEEVMDRAAARQ